MSQLVSHGLKREFVKANWEDESDELPFKSLNRVEAQTLRQSLTWFSPWRVIAMQALVGMLCAWVAGVVMGSALGFWSALYGAASVVVPNILHYGIYFQERELAIKLAIEWFDQYLRK